MMVLNQHRRRIRLSAVLLSTLVVLASSLPSQSENEERKLIALWKTHSLTTNQHVQIAKRCSEFSQAHPSSPFQVISELLAAWHLLAAERNEAGTIILERIYGLQVGDSIGRAAMTQARAWLTRMDHALVKKSLSAYYIDTLEYPETLNSILNVTTPPPLKDRWNQPWMYQAIDFQALKGFNGQRYKLESDHLGPRTDLSDALSYPYGKRLRLRPIRYMSQAPDKSILEVEVKRSTNLAQVIALTVGSESDGISFAFEGQHCIVLSDGDYWHISPPPAHRQNTNNR